MNRLAYVPVGILGAATQAVHHADRPACALAAAWADFETRGYLLGEAKGISPTAAFTMLTDSIKSIGVDVQTMGNWVHEGLLKRSPVRHHELPQQLGGMTLSQYQVDAALHMTTAGGVLGLGCGLGKTLVMAAITHALATQNPGRRNRIFVICPLNAVPTWKAAQSMFPQGSEVHIVSMDSAHHLAGADLGGVVIFDEAHLLGEQETRRTKACHELRTKMDAGFCLTGTLLHGGVHKALSVMDLAIPGAAGFTSRWKAGEHFHCLVRKPIGGRTVTVLERPKNTHREAFHKYLARHCVMLTVDSPSVQSAIALPGQHLFDTLIDEPWSDVHTVAAAMVQAELDATGEVMTAAALAHKLAAMGIDSKVDWVLQNVEDSPVVIFANYTDSLDKMEAALKSEAMTYVRVDGAVTGPARIEAQRRFQDGEVQVFLGQMAAASVSMNLQRARYSIALDHSWRAADYAQALARTHRRGQQHETFHWDLVANEFQRTIVRRLRAQEDFNSESAEYQQMKTALLTSGT